MKGNTDALHVIIPKMKEEDAKDVKIRNFQQTVDLLYGKLSRKNHEVICLADGIATLKNNSMFTKQQVANLKEMLEN